MLITRVQIVLFGLHMISQYTDIKRAFIEMKALIASCIAYSLQASLTGT